MAARSPPTAARAFGDFRYRTQTSWTRRRRVVAKAEYLAKGENPRFVVTLLRAEQAPALQRLSDSETIFACGAGCRPQLRNTTLFSRIPRRQAWSRA